MPRSDRLQRQRKIDGYAVAAIAPVAALIPAWLIAVAVFWSAVDLFFPLPFALFAGVWFICGGLLFLRPMQRVVLTRLLGARMPTRNEKEKMLRSWSVVAQANHIPPGKFVFAITDSDELNAFASGGHLVVVSSWAVENLSQDELCGVLAHELSHHLGMHTIALTVGQWLTIPIVLLAQVGFFLQNAAHAATDTFARSSTIGVIIGRTVAGFITIISWLFLVVITLSQYIGNAIGKGVEFKADETVVAMGFGKQLRNALRIVVESGNGEREQRWQDRLITAHPPARTRVARIEAQLRANSRR
jgi:Zn-dependent protease with chaperone function